MTFKGDNVMRINEVPFNIGGEEAWLCQFETRDQAAGVQKQAFNGKIVLDFSPIEPELFASRARMQWNHGEKTFYGDVLVDNELNPIGFLLKVHTGQMVFSLEGSHIPVPRFPNCDS